MGAMNTLRNVVHEVREIAHDANVAADTRGQAVRYTVGGLMLAGAAVFVAAHHDRLDGAAALAAGTEVSAQPDEALISRPASEV